jgi:hypothetical protein
MDLAILGLTASSVSGMGAILAGVSFWLNRGKVEESADQALARAKERNDRYDRIMSAFADYRAAIAADIAIVKSLAETNTAARASAENRLAAAIELMNNRFGELERARITNIFSTRMASAEVPPAASRGIPTTAGTWNGARPRSQPSCGSRHASIITWILA